MQLPIPDDWDGGWVCVQVDWPDSIEYIALLAGLLSMLARGRLYDERTGSVIDAQAIGRDVWARNWPLRMCAGGGDTIDVDDERVYGAIAALGDMLMPAVNGQIIGVEWRGCELWVRTYPCCEWQLVGQPCDSTDIEDPSWPEDSTYSACGKAYAVVDAMYTIAQGVWDNKDGPLYWQHAIDGSIDGLLAGVDVDNQGLLALLNGARALDDTYTEDDMFDADLRQQYLCRVSPLLSDDATGMSIEQYDQVRTAINQVYPDAVRVWWQDALGAIGARNLSTLAAAAATDTSRDCSCPDPSTGATTPDASGWYLSAEYDVYTVTYTNDSGAERHLLVDVTPEHDVFGAVWTHEVSGLNYKIMDANTLVPTIQDWGLDTSGNETGYKSRVSWGPSALWDIVYGSGAYYHLGEGNLDSTTPGAPATAGTGGNRQGIAAESVFNHGGTITVSKLRLLHNINSPSHA
jgi:hypothetical protein